MPEQGPLLSDAAVSFCYTLVLLIPFGIAGIALISTGLGRSRSATHALLLSLCAAAVAMLAYFVCGFAFQGSSGGGFYVFSAGNAPWNWLGAGPFFLRGFEFSNAVAPLTLLFGLLGSAMAAAIPIASGAERWRLAASCLSTALLASWTYPLFAHWVWGGGWLMRLGLNFGLGRGFIDPGGTSCIQAVGGLTALCICWILGPRRGKFTSEGVATAVPGHNAVIVLFGCLLALPGWFGLNSAGAILFAAATPGQTVLIAVNTALCASSAAITALVTTRVRFGRPDASLAANGWISGLVASGSGAAFFAPAEAVLTGLVAGFVVMFSVEFLELRFKIDDPAGAVSVHGIAGIWGILAAGILGQASSTRGQLLAQLAGIATLLGFITPLSYILNWVLNRIVRQRVAAEGERQGMDLFELGAGAYPEFVIHREDFTRH